MEMRHTPYNTYPQNISRLPVRILNKLVAENRLEPLPIDGDSALAVKQTLRKILAARQPQPMPRTQAQWHEFAKKRQPP